MTKKLLYDRTLITIVLIILGFGLIMVFSASIPISKEVYNSQSAIFTRQLLAVILGLVALLITMKIDYRFYQRPSVVYTLVGLSMALLIYVLMTPSVVGVQRWIRFGFINFQPSEIAKLVVIIFSSFYLTKKKEQLNSFSRGLLPFSLIVGTIIILVAVEPDLGTAISIGITAGFLLFIGGLYWRYIIASSLIVSLLIYLMIINTPYRMNRILAFLYPEKDLYGIGYQVHQSLISIGSGGMTGLGFAQGKQKLFFVPEPHTDFIFAVVGEELGLLGCLLVLILFGLLFWKSIQIAIRAKTPFGTLLGLGIGSTIVFQALINVSVTLGLVPAKGLPLPFISVGGSSMILMLSAIGILLNISSQTRSQDSKGGWIKIADA